MNNSKIIFLLFLILLPKLAEAKPVHLTCFNEIYNNSPDVFYFTINEDEGTVSIFKRSNGYKITENAILTVDKVIFGTLQYRRKIDRIKLKITGELSD